MIADPGDRQIGHDLVGFVELVEIAADFRSRDHRIRGQHHALRASGRAGCVEDDGEIRTLAVLQGALDVFSLLRLRETCASFLDDGLDGVKTAVVVIPQALLLVVEHMLKLRQLLGDGEDLVDLLLVLHRRVGHFGMGQYIGHLLRDRVRIDRDRDRADPLGSGDGPVEIGTVVADDCDLAATLQPDRLQPARIGADDLVHLAPGPGLPDAEVLVPKRSAVRSGTRVAHQELGKCVRARIRSRRQRHPSLTPAHRDRAVWLRSLERMVECHCVPAELIRQRPYPGFVGRYSVVPVRGRQGAATRYHGLIGCRGRNEANPTAPPYEPPARSGRV